LAIYSTLILLASILGGYLPFFGRVTHSRLQLYLSASAGVMLGASFFHVMPEALELAGDNFGWWMSLGVVGLFCIERFIAPHSHEMNGSQHHHDEEQPSHDHAHGHDHDHPHDLLPKEQRAAAPAVAGWMAVLGLTIHTFMNGVGLAGSVQSEMAKNAKSPKEFIFPGLAMFLAIVLHKPADALAISTVLSRKGVARNLLVLVQFGFALMVPVGAIAFHVLGKTLQKNLENELTGAALAFSAGTFLFVALSDLLPEVQFHKHDRIQLFLALTLGVALMGGISYLEHLGGHHH
jgi:zinc and cadmium transporter